MGWHETGSSSLPSGLRFKWAYGVALQWWKDSRCRFENTQKLEPMNIIDITIKQSSEDQASMIRSNLAELQRDMEIDAKKSMNIAVLYLSDNDFKDVSAFTLPAAQSWARRHGYMLHEVFNPLCGRNIQWHRVRELELLLNLGPDLDYVLHLDADALITNPAIHLEDLIEKYGPFDIAMSREISGAWNDGVCLFANTQRTRDFLQVAWEMEGPDVTSMNGAIQKLFDAGTLADYVRLVEIPKREFNSYPDDWKPGDFVLHTPGHSNNMRSMIFRKMLNEVLIPIKELLRPYQLTPSDRLVRLGREMDGGYLVPKSALQECDTLVSCGIGDEWKFEKDFYDYANGNMVAMYDHTVQLSSVPGFEFYKAKCTPDFIRRHQFPNRFILKLDIEGDEYACLSNLLQDPVCIVVEFHWIDKYEAKLRCTLGHLHEMGFRIVHLHGNNHGRFINGLPETIEVTFVNTKVIPVGEPFRDKLPLAGLDFPNNPDVPDYVIEFP